MNDQYAIFKTKDQLDFDKLEEDIPSHDFSAPVVCYKIDNTIHISSSGNFTDGVPLFLLKISHDLRLSAFHAGIRYGIPTLMKNRISILDSWPELEEAIRFLHYQPWNQQKFVIKERLESMGAHKLDEKCFSTEIIVMSFQYCATSRFCYEKLRKDYKLHRTWTLRI